MTLLQIISSVLAGVIVGMVSTFVRWPTFERLTEDILRQRAGVGDIKISESWRDHRAYQKRVNRTLFPYIVIGGFSFYILGYVGQGALFGLDFGSKGVPEYAIESFICNGVAIYSAVLGCLFGIYLGAIDPLFDIGIMLQSRWGYVLVFIVCFNSIFWAIVLSIFFFNETPFFVVAVVCRLIGLVILPKLSHNAWRAISNIFILLSIVMLPLLAYLSRTPT